MREYDSYEDACRDPDLDLMIIWRCDSCGQEYEDRPGYNEGGICHRCGGTYQWAGESYNG